MDPTPNKGPVLYAGVMTGTSMDAVDVALVEIASDVTLGHVQERIRLAHFLSRPIDSALAEGLMDLQHSDEDEIHRAALISNVLSDAISRALLELLATNGLKPSAIRAAGIHGQTVRHRPELGYTVQLLNPARIAEATSLTVVSDFRSKDIAAGGQGAPLVPIFHRAIFGHDNAQATAVVNIGGIANVSWLSKEVLGYDTGPGNMLMDAWCRKNLGKPFDQNGQWAKSGVPNMALLEKFLAEPFFSQPAPRSTGRDLFNLGWLEKKTLGFAGLKPEDIQATLLLLTAQTISQEIAKLTTRDGPPDQIIICGGGALNTELMHALSGCIEQSLKRKIPVQSSSLLGWPPQAIEAAAFAWLAHQTIHARPVSLSSVTGALGPRVLGSITPA